MLTKRYRPWATDVGIHVGQWVDGAAGYGNVTMGMSLPARIDFATGTVTPLEIYGKIEDESQSARYRGRNWVHGAVSGTFLEVTGTDGECLNVRGKPLVGAEIVGCYAEGVLLRANGWSGPVTDGELWFEVTAPDGKQGYAAGAYLRE